MRKITRQRRRMLLLDGLCIAVIAAGALLRDVSRMLGIVLTLGGIACLLVLFLLTARAFCSRCPSCGYPIWGRAFRKTRFRRPVYCPRCGAVVTDDNLTQ